jgi:hypothetical protein
VYKKATKFDGKSTNPGGVCSWEENRQCEEKLMTNNLFEGIYANS